MYLNIPDEKRKRIVIVGAGFGGITLVRKLIKSNFQVVLLVNNNIYICQIKF